ncbi:MAG: PD-(D/E)XK nuclease-like domain-containing protein [Bryobacteraceae bacterium]
MTVAASFLIHESAEVYQAKAKEYLTSHQLADFRRCPLLYRKKKLGLIEEEDRPAFLVGRALHTLVLEGRDAFEEQYAVGGPVNPKTGELYGSSTKAFAEWAARQRKPVLTVQQHELVQRMAEGVRGHGLARDLLSEGTPEGVVRAEYCQMPCQIRMDWFDPHRGIVDLKTCDDLDWFEADAR